MDTDIDLRYSLDDDDMDEYEEDAQTIPSNQFPPVPLPEPSSEQPLALAPVAESPIEEPAEDPVESPPQVSPISEAEIDQWLSSTELLLRQCPWEEAARLCGSDSESVLLQPLLTLLEQLVNATADGLSVRPLLVNTTRVCLKSSNSSPLHTSYHGPRFEV